VHELLNFYNLDPNDNLDESLRMAVMFKDEVDEATDAYMEMIQLTVDPERHGPEEITRIVEEAINAALVTGLRAYRPWIQSQGVDVAAVEEASGKDIPPHTYQPNARWPM
jgi:hypothetical protein